MSAIITPFPHQAQGVSEIRKAMANGNKRTLYVLPTGGGKTVVFTMVTKMAVEKNSKVMILVHRDSLFKQTSKTLDKFEIRHGLIGAGYSHNYFRNVQIAKIGSVVNRLDRFTPNLIIIDECHHATAGQYQKIMQAYPNAYVLGVTATPCRTDGRGLGEVFSEMIIGQSISELVEMGYLVNPTMFSPASTIDFDQIKVSGADFNLGQLESALAKGEIVSDAVSRYKKHAEGRKGVVFCVSIKHAEMMAESFREAGYNAASLSGKMHQNEIDQIIAALESGEIKIITSCDLISEGTDIPSIDVAIMARPTMSESLYIQQAGRVLRTDEGKTDAIIIDLVGNYERHGHILAEREWTLEGKKKSKKKTDGEKETVVKICESCYAAQPSAVKVCTYCGTEFKVKARELKEVDKELIEIDPRIIKQQKKEKRMEEGRAVELEDLLKIEIERGYAKGWALIKYNSRQNKKA